MQEIDIWRAAEQMRKLYVPETITASGRQGLKVKIRLVGIAGLVGLLAGGCMGVNLADDKPAETYVSDKSPDAMRDCIVQQGLGISSAIKTSPFKGGTMIDHGWGRTSVVLNRHLVCLPSVAAW